MGHGFVITQIIVGVKYVIYPIDAGIVVCVKTMGEERMTERIKYYRMGGWFEGYVGIAIDGEPWEIIK